MSRRVVALVALLLVGCCAGGRTTTAQANMEGLTQGGDARGRGDQPERMTIEGDRLDRIDKDRLVIFIGNVVVQDHDWLLFADRVEVYLSETGGHILTAIAIGNVRIAASECRKGIAERVVYRSRDHRVVLSGNARL